MAVRLNFKLDTRQVIRAMRRVPERTRRATAQELNRQRTRSRTLMTRQLSRVLGVKPQKRIRRRIVLPRNGRARPQRLTATGLSLVETMPGRWFAKGKRGRGSGFTMVLPGGSKLRETRSTRGQPFSAEVKSGHLGIFRRVNPPQRRQGPKGPTWLPIQEVMVDTTRPGYRVRDRVLNQLAREWPDVWQRRMRREFKRLRLA